MQNSSYILLFITLLICFFVLIKKSKKEISNKELSNLDFFEKHGNIIFIVILLVSSISIFYKLGQIPQELHQDEAGEYYDAICISNFGVDRYLNTLPVYFINFGDGQNALYTYLAAITFKIFGISYFTFRLPAALLSLITLICIYFTVKKNLGIKQALITSFILAICPWNIMKSRWGLESYLMCSMLTISICIFINAVNSNSKKKYFLPGIFFGLTLYTYAISYVVIPAMLAIILIYLLITKKTKISNIICLAIPLGLLALPLLLMIALNSRINRKFKISNIYNSEIMDLQRWRNFTI